MHRLAIILFALLSSHCCQASDKAKDAWTFSIHEENDLFASTDQNYTNGTKLSWTSPDITEFSEALLLQKWVPEWISSYAEKLHISKKAKEGLDLEANEPDQKKVTLRNVVLSLGQNMYSPQAIWESDLILDDRPYGGWTYLGVTYQTKSYAVLDSWEFNLGIVGPYSYASDIQKFIHHYSGSPRPKGWHNQIGTEIGINLAYLHKSRFFEYGNRKKWSSEIIGHYGGSLGNVQTYLNGGFEARMGYRMPTDFGNALIRMAADSSAPFSADDFEGFGGAVFFAADGRGVLRDIFLDGNTFRDSHSLEKYHLFGDLSAGITLRWQRLKISYTQVFRTRQYKIQEDEHTFGSVNISFTK